MRGNIISGKRRFTPINLATYAVVGGAAGYVDTNVSPTTGTNTDRLWLVGCKNDAFQNAGCRPHGETTDNKWAISNSATFVSKVDSSGHMDLYREAANTGYYLMGYWE